MNGDTTGLNENQGGAQGKGAALFFLVVFIAYAIWMVFLKVSTSSIVERALDLMEYRYWEYTGYALFLLFLFSALLSRRAAGAPATVQAGGVSVDVVPTPTPSEGITPVERLAIPAKMAGEVKEEKKSKSEAEKAILEYPPKVGPGIYGDTYIPITEEKMLKLRVRIVEPEYLGAGGD